MATDQFVIKHGLICNDDAYVQGNITASGIISASAFSGSLYGTSSWALNSVTSSYVSSSGIDGTVLSSSYSLTSSYSKTGTSSSYANTSSYILASNIAGTVSSASYSLTSSAATSITFTPNVANTASYVSANNIYGTVTSASYALTSSAASSITFTPTLAISASYLSGSTAIVNNMTVTGVLNAEQISGSQVYITSSHLTVTNNILELNAQTPHLRYAGISVFDSGSTSQTANFLWDGLNNYFFLSSSAEISYSRQIATGPENEAELPVNVIPMAYAYNGLTSSIISQSATTIGIAGNVVANSFTGSLSGSSSYALSSSYSNSSSYSVSSSYGLSSSYALSASYIPSTFTASYVSASNIDGTVLSSSYSLSASYSPSTITASWANNSISSSYATSLQLYDVGLGRFVTIQSNNGILEII